MYIYMLFLYKMSNFKRNILVQFVLNFSEIKIILSYSNLVLISVSIHVYLYIFKICIHNNCVCININFFKL